MSKEKSSKRKGKPVYLAQNLKLLHLILRKLSDALEHIGVRA